VSVPPGVKKKRIDPLSWALVWEMRDSLDAHSQFA